MRLDEIRWEKTPQDIKYSQYLKRSDGLWCRALHVGESGQPGAEYKFQYMYQYPAPDWDGGMWSRTGPLTALELSCLLQHCTPTDLRWSIPFWECSELRVPKDHFLPWTEAELAEMLPITIKP